VPNTKTIIRVGIVLRLSIQSVGNTEFRTVILPAAIRQKQPRNGCRQM